MQVRNISADERFIASAAHDFFSGLIAAGETIDVPDPVGKSLCDQTDIWERVKTTKAHAADKAGE